MSKRRLYLIDATAFCYRAYYALKGLATSFGQPTNAIYGFIGILNKILKEKNPQFMAVCFDVSRDTFRLKKFAEYKIQRPAMPDGLVSQIPLIKEIVSAYGIAMYQKLGFEADDVIATLSQKAKQKGLPVIIVSSDKDILQLVDEDTHVFSPYKDEGMLYDRDKVRQRFGVGPEAIPDIIALMGDDVDNIPGVPGIGEKTAAELIGEFGSLEKLLNNVDKIKKEKAKKAILQNLEKIRLSKELAVLDGNMDIDFELDELKIKKPDPKELFRLFKYLEFKKFIKDLGLKEEAPKPVEVVPLADGELSGLLGSADELILYGEDAQNLVFYSKDKFLRADKTGPQLKGILADPAIKKISHDLKRLRISLANDKLVLKGMHFDTMIAAYLLSSSRSGYTIADLAWDYLDKTPCAESIDHQQGASLIRELKPILERELKAKELSELFARIEMPLVEVLAEMELSGIKLDLDVLKELSRDIEKRLIKLIEDIYDISGTQFNINSPKQLRGILFEKLKLPVVKKRKTGPSTDEWVLKSLASQHKLPALLLEYRQLSKLKSTYIDALPQLADKVTGRIHTSFNQTGTETGRLSSSNPNLQNLPVRTEIGRKIRKAIIAGQAGTCLISFDYSQIELRILAHLSSDEELLSAFRNNQDIHIATACLIYGLDQKDITDEMRDVAKRINFGIIYGLSSYGLSRDLGISQVEAANFIDAYFLRYPQVGEYIQSQIEKAKRDGFVTTILGRRRYIPEINHKNSGIRQFSERQAVNTPIQGSAADLIKQAMVEVYQRIQSLGLKSKLILQIHDELVFEVPLAESDALIQLVREKMEGCCTFKVPIKVTVKKGKNWLEMEEVE
ncbi:DNA polymerase I [Candidatus Omnitrophota bacterium]